MQAKFGLSASLVILLAASNSLVAKPTTVALTTTVSATSATEEKQLTANLLSLLEVEASQHDSLQVVERQQLDLALHEQFISNTNNEQQSLQLGKLSTAELLLTAKFEGGNETQSPRVLVRVTESRTAVIRGVTIVPTSAAEIEETAAEIINFLLFHTQKQSKAPTIAVLPFECIERFDRLRPLERGLRDFMVSSLMQQSNCRVVQRSSMQQLLEELELVRAGLTDEGQGLASETNRHATYVIRGEIDERIAGAASLVLVKAQLVEASSRRVVARIDKSCKRDRVPKLAAEIVTEVLQVATGAARPLKTSKLTLTKEIDTLFESALRDIHRVHRSGPIGRGYRPWSIPGVRWPSGRRPSVNADSELGQHLLKKSIDRLESILFIEPHRLNVALPLAYCRSFHLDEIWNPEQCEQLLRRIRSESSDPNFIEEASLLLADMYFPHQGNFPYYLSKGEYDKELLELAFQRRLEMLIALAKDPRVESGGRLFNLLKQICQDTRDQAKWRQLYDSIRSIEIARDQTSKQPEHRPGFSSYLMSLAYSAVKNRSTSPKLKSEAHAHLIKWGQSENPWRRMFSRRYLYLMQEISAEQYSQSIDDAYHGAEGSHALRTYCDTRVWLAKHLMQSGELEKALTILLNTKRRDYSKEFGYDFGYGQYGYTLAKCYESLGRKQEALDIYVRYAELPHGYSHGYDTDFMNRIKSLGGVPLSQNRDIQVDYPKFKGEQPFHCRVLATNGKQLFCGGGYEQGHVGKSAVPIRSVHALDLQTNAWTLLGGPDDRVACLVVKEGFLWAGTDSKGLWRQNLSTGEWRSWNVDHGMPTNSIIELAVSGHVAYCSVGNLNQSGFVVSGGVVRVDSTKTGEARPVHIYTGNNSPETAPVSMAIHNEQLVVLGLQHKLRSLNLNTNQWTLLERKSSSIVDSGSSGIWLAPRDYIATRLHQYKNPVMSYLADARLKDYPAGKYLPRFFLEHDEQLWIGGPAWRRFGDSGLFRLNLKSGELKRYGPRDGFRYSTDHRYNGYECYDGVWANNSLWIATSFGLAKVTERDPTQTTEQTPVEKYASQVKVFLPAGWELTANSASIRLLRKEPVLVTPLHGRPPRGAEESEEAYLQRIGSMIPLEINFSFVPRLSREKYEMFTHRIRYLDQIAKSGFQDKVSFSRYLDERAKAKLPIYFDQDHSIYVDGVPPQYTMHDKAAQEEIQHIFNKLKTILQVYEGADPLAY